MLRILFFFFLICLQLQLWGQNQRARELRSNVVLISAQEQKGFGFITGDRNNDLFVVTAAHVVEAALESGGTIKVKFFQERKPLEGEVILFNKETDIALVEVKKPASLSWSKNCLGILYTGLSVTYVGRRNEWYIPTKVFNGMIHTVRDGEILVDIAFVEQGTSGAPLITNEGIVGMITSSDGGPEVRAVSIDQLKSKLSDYDYFFELIDNDNKIEVESTENSGRVKDLQGNTYTTKVMKDGYHWTTQNLNIEIPDSWCYDNDPQNCEKYGRLYTWKAAQEGCKFLGYGWHLPTEKDWTTLATKYKGYFDVVNFRPSGNAEQAYDNLIKGGTSDFDILFGGFRNSDGVFNNLEDLGDFWSSTAQDDTSAWEFFFNPSSQMLFRGSNHKRFAFSVRCKKDD